MPLPWCVCVIFAQAPPAGDSNSLFNLIGGLGAAGGAVVITIAFLNYLKESNLASNRLLDGFKEHERDSQEKFQAQLDRMAQQQAESQRAFQEQIRTITSAQNEVLRDAIVAMKSVEKTVEGSTSTIRAIERSVESLGTAVRALDTMVRATRAGARTPPGLESPPIEGHSA